MLKGRFLKFTVHKLLLSLLVGFLSSCVGTIEETPSVQPSVEASGESVSFTGVESCVPIGHDKVDVYFGEATVNGSSDQANIVYQVFQDGNFDESAATAIGTQIPVDENGLFHLMVDGIPKNTEATFVVRAFDSVTGASDDNYITCLAKTLSSELPDFNGVREISTFPGIEGRSTLEIGWTQARPGKTIGTNLPKAGYAIAGYKIYFGKSPDALALFTNVPVSKDNHPTTYKFTGLSPGIKYYFKMNAYDESDRVDLNNVIYGKETNTPGTIEFKGVTSVTTPAGDSGYSTLVAHWEVAKGDFNAYKIFVIPSSKTSDFSADTIGANNTSYYVGKVEDVTQTSFTIPGLAKNTEHAVYVVACEIEASTCDTKTTVPKGDNKKIIGLTSPKLATYTGIKEVTALTGQAGLDQATLSWDLPVTDGVCDGINVKTVTGFNPVVATKLSVCPAPDGGACISKESSCTDTEVTVANMQTGLQYCFQTTVYSEGKETDDPNLNFECHTPKHTKPLFTGFPSCTVNGATQLDVSWTQAKDGLFSNYLLIYRKVDGTKPSDPAAWFQSFKGDFETGNLYGTGFEYKILSTDTLSKSLTGLSPNSEYKVMIKAYMNTGSDHYYDDNTSLPTGCVTDSLTLKSALFNKIISVGPSTKDLSRKEKISVELGKVLIDNMSNVGSEYGTVHFEWNDPKLKDGTSLLEIIDVLGDSLTNDDGFFVYKSVNTAPDLNSVSRTEFVNAMSGSPNWVLQNAVGIKVNPATKTASYTEELTGLDGRADASEAKLIWYVVKFKLAGTFIDFDTDEGGDYLFDVVLPPAGMALQHRSIVNKRMCTFFNKDTSTLDKDHYYRCSYDGLGAVVGSDSHSYYDTEGHVITDRTNLLCNNNQPTYNSIGNTIFAETVPGYTGFDSAVINECFVFVHPTKASTEPTGTYLNYVYEGSFFKEENKYIHLGTNYKYKPIPGNKYRDLFINSGASNIGTNSRSYILQVDETDSITFSAQQYCGDYQTPDGDLQPIECLGTNITRTTFFGPPDVYAWKHDFQVNYKAKASAINTIGYTKPDIWTSVADVMNDKDHFYVWFPRTQGVTYPTLQRNSNIVKHAFPTLPTGKGFSEGMVLNNEYSLYPSPLVSEIFGRTYANNKYTSNDNERLWGIGPSITTNIPYIDSAGVQRLWSHWSEESRTCEGVIYSPEFIIANGTESDYVPGYYSWDCPLFAHKKNKISNINASTANYLCQSHHLKVRTPVTTYGPIRKRPMSAREVMSSRLSDKVSYETYKTYAYDDFGSDQINTSLYLAGQALCETDVSSEGKCYTHPSSSLKASYESSATYGSHGKWPFFKFDNFNETRFADDGMYKNEKNGKSYFWRVTDNTNSRNIASTPNNEHFGIPQYTQQYTPDGGTIVTNYPLSQYNLSYVLGQPLWCDYEEETGSCGSDDKNKVANLPSVLSTEQDKYIQTPIRNIAETTAQINEVTPYNALYSPGVYMDQYHLTHDYEGQTVDYTNISDVFSIRWEKLDIVPEGDIGVRCSVKLKFDDTGKLNEVDGIEVP